MRCNWLDVPSMRAARGFQAAAILLPLLIAVFLTGCGAGGSHRPAPTEGPDAEPTGGRWIPVVLTSVSDFPLPAPSLPQLSQELQELRTLKEQRTSETNATVQFWNAGAVIRWNEIARSLVVKYKTPPPLAARVYALVSVAQYDALVVAWNHKYNNQRPAPQQMDREITPLVETTRDPTYPSEHAVVAAASAAVLTYLYPGEAEFLAGKATEHAQSRLWAGVNYRSDIATGDQLGREVARKIIEHAQGDGADAVWTGTIPTGGPGYWNGTKPLLPLWGSVKPWLMTSGSQLRPAPPPAYDSAEYQAALTEVRQISDTRTVEQLRIAEFWADGAGTITPPGHWNQIACDLIAAHPLNELRSARALALVNMAMMDAGICCWHAKYAFWLIRPSQADPAITTPVGLPNFPSYTSGHASFSGAAAKVLGYLFPNQKQALETMAEEAALSRLYGGIHYRFDSEVGLEGGRKIGVMAVERGVADGSPSL